MVVLHQLLILRFGGHRLYRICSTAVIWHHLNIYGTDLSSVPGHGIAADYHRSMAWRKLCVVGTQSWPVRLRIACARCTCGHLADLCPMQKHPATVHIRLGERVRVLKHRLPLRLSATTSSRSLLNVEAFCDCACANHSICSSSLGMCLASTVTSPLAALSRYI